jgi:hypothetical protein
MNSDKNIEANFVEIISLGCDSYTSVDIPFSQDGAGDFCFVTSGTIQYINSWNMELLEINGGDFTNVWSNNVPADQDGLYYIHYKGLYAWSHFEIAGTKSAELSSIQESTSNPNILAYPNPFSFSTSLKIAKPELVQKIILYNQLGKVVEHYSKADISNNLSIGSDLVKGIYFLYVQYESNSFNCLLNKK